MDNASIHSEKTTKLIDYCDKFDIQLIWNVKYRPEFNGIEGVWGWAKKKFRARIDWLKANGKSWDDNALVNEIMESIP